MNKFLTFFFFVALVVSAFGLSAESQPSQQLVQPTINSGLKLNEVVSLKPIKDHHFNLAAPQKCGEQDFVSKSAREMRCQLSKPGKNEVMVSVCDDAETFCQQQTLSFNVESSFFDRMLQGLWGGNKRNRPKGKQKKIEGFLVNQPREALAKAKKENKLLLVDFYGVWCPPCNYLDEFVFPTAEFKQTSKNMVKIALDADSEISFDWKDRFKIRGYPTVVLANEKLEEIGRVVGFVPKAEFVDFLEKHKNLPSINSLQAKQFRSVEESIRLVEWHHERNEHDLARLELEKIKSHNNKSRRLMLENDLAVARKKDDKEKVKSVLIDLASNHQGADGYHGWMLSLLQYDKKWVEQRKQQYFAKIDQALAASQSPVGQDDLYFYKAYISESLGEEETAKGYYQQAAEAAQKVVAMSPLETARGPNQSLAFYLRKSGKLEEAKNLYQKMAKAFPEEFTFHYGLASTLNLLEQYDDALASVDSALKYSYGDNWLRASHLKAKLQMAKNEKEKARSTLNSVLSEVTLPKSTNVRTYRYVMQIRDLLASLDKPEEKKIETKKN